MRTDGKRVRTGNTPAPHKRGNEEQRRSVALSMDTLLQDIRYGFRMLRKAPGFTIVAVLTLALGIGANTAVFSMVDALFLRPLPVRDADHLVAVFTSGKNSRGSYLEGGTSYLDLLDYRAGAPALAVIAGFDNRGSILRVGDDSILLSTCVVTANYFSMLGVPALHGRTFAEQEFQGSEIPNIVVVSHSFWRKYLGGDPKVVGTSIMLTGRSVTIAGILPPWFRGTQPMFAPDVDIPAQVWGRGETADRASAQFSLLGRLAPDASLKQAQAQLDTVGQRLAAAFPKERGGRVITAKWEREKRRTVIAAIILAIPGAVLLIACANVAALLMARSEARRREIATRVALGASRPRLTRQLLTESLLLSLLGMTVAVMVALWVIRSLPVLLPPGLPLGLDFRLDARTLLFSLAAALGAMIVFGVAPAIQACRVSLVAELKEGGGAGSAPGRAWTRDVLTVAQVALSVVLLTGAGLLVRTFIKASQQDLGFDSREQALMLQIIPGPGQPGMSFSTGYPQLLERLEAIPGVERATLANRAPLANYGGGRKKLVFVPGMQLQANERGMTMNLGIADGSYFQALGMALQRGRTFSPQDHRKAQRVAILNETAARQLFPVSNPLGQHIRLDGPEGQDCEVVGVLRDAKYNTVTEDTQPYMYVPFAQEGTGDILLLLKTSVAPESVLPLVRQELKRFDSGMSVFQTLTMAEHMRTALYTQRISAQLVGVLGALGLLLALIGLYGVLSYFVSRRRHEIGVRMAVGAQPGTVFRLIVARGLWLTILGIAIGTAGAFGATRVLSDLLYGVSPRDPVTLVIVALLLLAFAFAAAAIPARRAAAVHPLDALRWE